jgi:hypothetical protein
MIWFTCGKCGKAHGRPESSIGTLVFCECGQGNRVPWESTAAEPPPSVPMPVLQPGSPQSPTLAPLMFDSPAAPASAAPVSDGGRRRRGNSERRDPNYCLNHTSTAKSAICEDCGESFCAACVVTLEGATLCGPCKNLRVRTLELPPQASPTAMFSLLIALLTASILGFCLLPAGHFPGIGVLSLLTLLPQILALGLGIRALYLCQREPRIGGQGLAITGVTTAALCIALTLLLNLYGLRA